jgi:hypothetical protein
MPVPGQTLPDPDPDETARRVQRVLDAFGDLPRVVAPWDLAAHEAALEREQADEDALFAVPRPPKSEPDTA